MASAVALAQRADDTRYAPPEDLASASGILLFCVRRACAIPLRGTDSDGQFGWKVFNSFGLVYASTQTRIRSLDGGPPFSYQAGVDMGLACRTISRSWSKWIPHRVSCCDCHEVVRWHQIECTILDTGSAPREGCHCASQTCRHPRCVTCEDRLDNWADDYAPHEDDLYDTERFWLW